MLDINVKHTRKQKWDDLAVACLPENIMSTVARECKARRTNLCTAWTDYKISMIHCCRHGLWSAESYTKSTGQSEPSPRTHWRFGKITLETYSESTPKAKLASSLAYTKEILWNPAVEHLAWIGQIITKSDFWYLSWPTISRFLYMDHIRLYSSPINVSMNMFTENGPEGAVADKQ